MILKPIASEKAVKMIELDNTLLFEAPRTARRDEIKKEVEKVFDVKVDEVRVLIKLNKKFAYVRLKKESLAIDVATKLGMI
jgi:large subunit ribosomal protein L23